MLSPLFNDDMDRRLADLHAALSGDQQIAVQLLPAYDHKDNGQPERIVVDIVGTPRRLVFGIDMAAALAEQLEANNFGEAASAIRTRLSGPEA